MQNGRIEHALAAAAAPQPIIQTPINDVQTLALMACHLQGQPKTRVELAREILAESLVQYDNGRGIIELANKIKSRRALVQ